MRLSPENDVSSTKGIPVVKNGGGALITWNEDMDLVYNSWYGISPDGETTLYVIEGEILR